MRVVGQEGWFRLHIKGRTRCAILAGEMVISSRISSVHVDCMHDFVRRKEHGGVGHRSVCDLSTTILEGALMVKHDAGTVEL